MSLRSGAAGLAVALALVSASGSSLGAEEAPVRPAVGVRLDRQPGAVIVDALLPGQLLDWALARGEGGRRRILLLVSGAEQGHEGNLLLELDPEGGPLVDLDRDLAAEFNGLAAVDLDGDGRDELLVGRPGQIFVVGSPVEGSARPRKTRLVDLADLDIRSRPAEAGAIADGGPAELHLARLGALDLFRPDGEGGLARREVVELPVRAERRPGGIRLHSPEVTILEGPGGELRYVVGPEAVGNRRLRTLLTVPGEPEAEEIWSALPAPEVVQWRRYVVLDGRPMLIVTVNSADKLGIFERQRVRVYLLSADRTRVGGSPILEARTASRRWQRVWPSVVDWNGDGADDLALVQTDGLGGMKLVAECFLGDGAGGFSAEPLRTAVDRAVALPLVVPDLTGDGTPDLLVAGGGELAILPGEPGSKKRLVDKRPARVIGFTDSEESEAEVELDEAGVVVRERTRAAADVLELVDLDGDGREEILWLVGRGGHPRWDAGRVRIVRLDVGSP